MYSKAFKMQLKPGVVAEYKRRHDEIWPELSELLVKVGIRDYHIYLDEETLALFAFQKLTENNQEAELAGMEIMRKWWDYMADLMLVNEDKSPVCKELKPIFFLE